MNVLSLCDYSGKWAKPYADAGHTVFLVDPKHAPATGEKCWTFDGNIRKVSDTVRGFLNLYKQGWFGDTAFDVILMAPPCTHFSSSGARWFKDKDKDGRTEEHAQIVRDCLEVVEVCKPRIWALENPVGRIASVVPELGKWEMTFHPCDYGAYAEDGEDEAYTKRTCLWGKFNTDLEKYPIEPVFYTDKNGKRYSRFAFKLGGKSERTKTLRSNTPTGFSRAFFRANS